MSEFDFTLPPGAPSGEGGTLGVRDVIARAQGLIDTRRPAGGYPLAWYVEALNVGDASAIHVAAVRAAEAAAEGPGAR